VETIDGSLVKKNGDQVEHQQVASELALLGLITSLQQSICRIQESLQDWRPHHNQSAGQLVTAFVDPAVNLEIKELRCCLTKEESEIRKLKDELHAANFSADSVIGRRLISKCRTLQSENNDLGRLMSESQLQPLQLQVVAFQKQLEFYRQQMRALQELNTDLDEENERLTRQIGELTESMKRTSVNTSPPHSNFRFNNADGAPISSSGGNWSNSYSGSSRRHPRSPSNRRADSGSRVGSSREKRSDKRRDGGGQRKRDKKSSGGRPRKNRSPQNSDRDSKNRTSLRDREPRKDASETGSKKTTEKRGESRWNGDGGGASSQHKKSGGRRDGRKRSESCESNRKRRKREPSADDPPKDATNVTGGS